MRASQGGTIRVLLAAVAISFAACEPAPPTEASEYTAEAVKPVRKASNVPEEKIVIRGPSVGHLPIFSGIKPVIVVNGTIFREKDLDLIKPIEIERMRIRVDPGSIARYDAHPDVGVLFITLTPDAASRLAGLGKIKQNPPL